MKRSTGLLRSETHTFIRIVLVSSARPITYFFNRNFVTLTHDLMCMMDAIANAGNTVEIKRRSVKNEENSNKRIETTSSQQSIVGWILYVWCVCVRVCSLTILYIC